MLRSVRENPTSTPNVPPGEASSSVRSLANSLWGAEPQIRGAHVARICAPHHPRRSRADSYAVTFILQSHEVTKSREHAISSGVNDYWMLISGRCLTVCPFACHYSPSAENSNGDLVSEEFSARKSLARLHDASGNRR